MAGKRVAKLRRKKSGATRGVVEVARNRKRTYRRRHGFTVPLSMVIPAGLIAVNTYNWAKAYGTLSAAHKLAGGFTGYMSAPNQPDWRFSNLKFALLPLGVGYLSHKILSRVGVNRTLARMGVPFIRI